MSTAGADALSLIASSPYARRIVSWATPTVYRELQPEDRERVEGLKLFLDGALGARSAALGEPFLGGDEGFLVYKKEALLSELAWAASSSKRVAMHAIGREAIEQGVSALEELARDGLRFDRPRLEHVQFISLAQARRAKALGAVLSVQPNFNSDSVDYLDRLPPGLAAQNDPFRALIDGAGFLPGEDLLFGSDGMPQGPEYALRMSLFPPEEGQRLSLSEFIAGYGRARGFPSGTTLPGLRLEVDEEAREVKKVDA
jgi:predicted amidohydrolase YtcJ